MLGNKQIHNNNTHCPSRSITVCVCVCVFAIDWFVILRDLGQNEIIRCIIITSRYAQFDCIFENRLQLCNLRTSRAFRRRCMLAYRADGWRAVTHSCVHACACACPFVCKCVQIINCCCLCLCMSPVHPKRQTPQMIILSSVSPLSSF